MSNTGNTVQEVKQLLDDTLELGDRVQDFDESTLLLGDLPELDSMAVVTLVAAIEDQYGVLVEDDEISAETFETFGNLVAFVDQKLNA
jgi:acyl carrier protein